MSMSDKSWDEIISLCIEKSKVKDANGFTKFMKAREQLGYMFDYHLYARAFNIANSLTQDYDHFTVISGYEGVGKTTLASQFGSVVSPQSFRLASICMEMDDFIRALQVAQPGDTFLLDEGALFLFSREAMSGDNKIMVKLFTIMRQKNLHVVICIPNFFTIDSYIRDHRVGTLIQVSARGKYTAYTGKAIKIISKEGARYKNVGMVRVPNGTFWRGYFHKDLPVINDITPESYTSFKAEHMTKFLNDLSEGITFSAEHKHYITPKEASKLTGLSEQTLRIHVRNGQVKGKKLGERVLIDRDSLLSPVKADNPPSQDDVTKGEGVSGSATHPPINKEATQ